MVILGFFVVLEMSIKFTNQLVFKFTLKLNRNSFQPHNNFATFYHIQTVLFTLL